MTDATAGFPTAAGVEAMATVAPGDALGVQVMVESLALSDARRHRLRLRGGRQGGQPEHRRNAGGTPEPVAPKPSPTRGTLPALPCARFLHADHHVTHLVSGSPMSQRILAMAKRTDDFFAISPVRRPPRASQHA